jgi:hypothetical protein
VSPVGLRPPSVTPRARNCKGPTLAVVHLAFAESCSNDRDQLCFPGTCPASRSSSRRRGLKESRKQDGEGRPPRLAEPEAAPFSHFPLAQALGDRLDHLGRRARLGEKRGLSTATPPHAVVEARRSPRAADAAWLIGEVREVDRAGDGLPAIRRRRRSRVCPREPCASADRRRPLCDQRGSDRRASPKGPRQGLQIHILRAVPPFRTATAMRPKTPAGSASRRCSSNWIR